MTVPAKIALPQYAYHHNPETGQRSEVIIIQAQHINERYVVGAIDVEEHCFVVGVAGDFELFINRRQHQPEEIQLASVI